MNVSSANGALPTPSEVRVMAAVTVTSLPPLFKMTFSHRRRKGLAGGPTPLD